MNFRLLKKLILVVLTVSMLIGTLTVNVFAADEDPVSEARSAVVKIVHELIFTVNGVEIPAYYAHVGSGALLATDKDPTCTSTDLVLTAHHVIDDTFYASDWFPEGSEAYYMFRQYDGLSISGIPNLKFEEYILLDNDIKIHFSVDENAQSDQSDWAILHLEKTLSNVHALKLGSSADLKVNQNVWALGFPAKLESNLSQTYTKEDVIVTKGIINKTDYRFDTINASFIMHSATIAGGNSGGPLIDENGNIIGINVMVTSLDYGSAEYSYATPIDSVSGIASKLGLKLMSASDEQQKGTFPLLGLIIAIAAVLLIGGAVVVIIVVVSSNKKKAAQAAAAAAEAAAQRASASIPHLVVQTGRLAGRRYRIEGCVRIGRDGSQCQIVYPADTAGVSGAHCEVFVQNGVVYIRDLKSSYGTFIGNGMQLQPGNAFSLPIGSSFYLASPENTFTVQY